MRIQDLAHACSPKVSIRSHIQKGLFETVLLNQKPNLSHVHRNSVGSVNAFKIKMLRNLTLKLKQVTFTLEIEDWLVGSNI